MHENAQLLREKGYRVTVGRLRLLQLLQKAAKPLTIREILKRSKAERLNQATLYRALEDLSKRGVVSRVDLNSGTAHYELAQSHHHHVVCNNCGLVEDITGCVPVKLERKVLKESQFKSIYSHNLEFFGSCKSCSK